MALTISGNSSSLLRLLTIFNKLETERSLAMVRLATGKRINRGADDPAGLIALSSLQSEQAAVEAAIQNNARSRSIMGVADGALTEVRALLIDIESLVVASAGDSLSTAEKAANQVQIDSALDAVDRIINDATFAGKRLFGGANEINTTMTAAVAADLKDIHIYSRNPNAGSTSLTFDVTAAAVRASTSGTSIANITAALSATTVVTIAGKDGTATITFASGSSLASMVTAINSNTALNGVSATASGTELRLDSTDLGSEAFVSITAISGDNDVVSTANTGRLSGTDATVTVNGQTAMTSGTEIYYSGGGISLSATLVDNTVGQRTITVTGGGATFQLGVNASTRITVGLNNLNTYTLGRSDLGYLSDLRSGGTASIASDPAAAASIVRKAVIQVASQAGRIGGFIAYQVDASTNSLNVARENLGSAISVIGDTDMAKETANLERLNLLASVTIALLGFANSQQRSVLGLLQQ